MMLQPSRAKSARLAELGVGPSVIESRTFVSFEWSAPDEDQFGPEGDVTTPGGRSIMETIRSGLVKQGLDAEEIEQHEAYGWCFDTASMM
jgi:hypothetical protein